MGAQDDFNLALGFVTDFRVTTPTMLWRRSPEIWNQYGVLANSQWILMSADLTKGTSPMSGFSSSQQQEIIDELDQFA